MVIFAHGSRCVLGTIGFIASRSVVVDSKEFPNKNVMLPIYFRMHKSSHFVTTLPNFMLEILHVEIPHIEKKSLQKIKFHVSSIYIILIISSS